MLLLPQDASAHPADWSAIAAVRAALRVPVLANGGVRCLADAQALLTASGAEGVLSAEPLLHDPVLFSSQRLPTVMPACRGSITKYSCQQLSSCIRICWQH